MTIASIKFGLPGVGEILFPYPTAINMPSSLNAETFASVWLPSSGEVSISGEAAQLHKSKIAANSIGICFITLSWRVADASLRGQSCKWLSNIWRVNSHWLARLDLTIV